MARCPATCPRSLQTTRIVAERDSFGKLTAAGAKIQEIEAGFGHVIVVTSDNPTTVEKIHAMADRTVDEMAKMAAAAG